MAVRSTLAGSIASRRLGVAAATPAPTATASPTARTRATPTAQAAWASTVRASQAGPAPIALVTAYSRSLARVAVNMVRATTAKAMRKPMVDMMRMTSALMSRTMPASCPASSARVCTVASGSAACSRRASSPGPMPGRPPTST